MVKLKYMHSEEMSLIVESPTAFAQKAGKALSLVSSAGHKKRLGQFLTPSIVANFMASLASPPLSSRVRIVDPGAGAGILGIALAEKLAESGELIRSIEIDAFENDHRFLPVLKDSLSNLSSWLERKGITLISRIHSSDFVLSNACALGDQLKFGPDTIQAGSIDFVISNPPYTKIRKDDRRARAMSSVVHGQPNIYALFMAVSAALLREGGELVFVTPRSYAAGPYFRQFRQEFFGLMRPKHIHLFDSRRETFDNVLQESMILDAIRQQDWQNAESKKSVTITSSNGASDICLDTGRKIELSQVMDWKSHDKILKIPLSGSEDEITSIIHSWPGSFAKNFLQISTGPVVSFRAERFLSADEKDGQRYAPLLWLQHVLPMTVRWPSLRKNKEEYIIIEAESRRLLLPNENYVLIRRFSAKEEARRLVAAPFLADSSPYP